MPFIGGAGSYRIHFANNRTGKYQIYSMNPDGSDIRQLTTDATVNHWWPRVSPDGKTILYYKATTFEDYTGNTLMQMDTDGGNKTALIAPGGVLGTVHGHVEWSPNGQKLCHFGSFSGNTEIFTTNTDGTNAVRITSDPGSIDPSWNPNGVDIIYAYNAGAGQHIYTVTTASPPHDGTLFISGDEAADPDYDPYYSPNGQYVAWITNRDATKNLGIGNFEIYRCNANGTGKVQITSDLGPFGEGGINSKPHWTPDSTQMYYHRFDLIAGEGHWTIIRCNADGSKATQIGIFNQESVYPDYSFVVPAASRRREMRLHGSLWDTQE